MSVAIVRHHATHSVVAFGDYADQGETHLYAEITGTGHEEAAEVIAGALQEAREQGIKFDGFPSDGGMMGW